ncbi:MAG: electron transfer flavoprotein subunit beta/FixA family protein [Planctomycetaceae bacterium]|jgi:electron transfer flavoprotein beta subunit|nr:electron transfer flavoprotein subunit beta/FixA family protein [Planctomycetaceae bacterium]
MPNSIVLVKQVPDTSNVTSDAMKEDGTVNRAVLPAIFNPDDLHALEAALLLKDRFGGKVTVVSMGPPKAAEILRDTLYRGADRAILITDRRAAASDTLATSYILSQAVRTIGDYDFVFAGRQAIDGDTAQTAPQCAEKLGIPQVTCLIEIVEFDAAAGIVTVKRDIGDGWEVLKVRLPALFTVIETANTPRSWSVKKLMRHKNDRIVAEIKPEQVENYKAAGRLIEQWNLDDIGADINRCGNAGSPTKVFRIQSVVLTKEGYTDIPPTQEGINALIKELISIKTV